MIICQDARTQMGEFYGYTGWAKKCGHYIGSAHIFCLHLQNASNNFYDFLAHFNAILF